MNNTTETLTKKLHERSDRQLKDRIQAWSDAMPMPPGGYNPHHIQVGGSRNLANLLYDVREALITFSIPHCRDAEVTAFLAQVNVLQDVLDNQ